MEKRPIGTPEEELARAEKRLYERHIELTGGIGKKSNSAPQYRPRGAGPRPGGGGNAGAVPDIDSYDPALVRLKAEYAVERERLKEIARTHDIRGRAGEQLARDALLPREPKVARESASETPSREFKAQTRQPDQFDKPRQAIERDAARYDQQPVIAPRPVPPPHKQPLAPPPSDGEAHSETRKPKP